MQTPIRFGFVGAGQIAHNSVEKVNSHPDGKAVAVTDTNFERAQELCTSKGVEHACRNTEELFARDDVDAVYIAVPNKFHAPLAIAALKAGKHVLLEKPFATNYAEAHEVIQTANETAKVFSLGMNYRLRPEVQKARAVVETGALGELYHGKAWWYRRKGIPKLGTWFGNKALSGGGSLYDIGVHYLDLCLYLMGEFKPVSVSGATYTKFGNRGAGEGGWGMSERTDIQFDVDDFASALIRLESGATITLDVAWACHTEQAHLKDIRLFGTDAGMLADPCQLFRQNNETGEYETVTDFDVKIPFPHGDRFHNMINHLLGREPLSTSHEEALAVQKILDAIAESTLSGKEVAC